MGRGTIVEGERPNIVNGNKDKADKKGRIDKCQAVLETQSESKLMIVRGRDTNIDDDKTNRTPRRSAAKVKKNKKIIFGP